jgi:hypothetical protein
MAIAVTAVRCAAGVTASKKATSMRRSRCGTIGWCRWSPSTPTLRARQLDVQYIFSGMPLSLLIPQMDARSGC